MTNPEIQKKIEGYQKDKVQSIRARDEFVAKVNNYNVRIAQLEGAIHALSELVPPTPPEAATVTPIKKEQDGSAEKTAAE